MDEKGVIVEFKVPGNPNSPEAPSIAIEIKKETYVPLYDLQGNITCLLDHQRRKVVETYRYSVFGEEEIINERGRVISDSSAGNPWRYRGKRVDKEVGLMYFGYRYYDPEVGRWISPDPLGAVDGPNLYAYARNNPMKYVDCFGLSSAFDENCGCTQHGHPGWHNAPEGCVCICGRNGSAYSAGSYRSKIGSDIKSAICGVSHGVVDFVVGSLHDLQTAATYMGAAELEISLEERIHLIEAVEQSQADQMAKVGNWVMDMLSIDESDSVYHSFRSTATTGLEIGSLIAGGYGAVKWVIAFNKLAKMPMQVSRLIKAESLVVKNIGQSNKIWTSTKKRTSVQNAYRHWKDHGHEFSTLQNSKQYVEATRNFTQNPPSGTLTKIRPNVDVVLYNPSSNTFAITNEQGLPRTMYKPDPLIHNYSTNLEYFYGQ